MSVVAVETRGGGGVVAGAFFSEVDGTEGFTGGSGGDVAAGFISLGGNMAGNFPVRGGIDVATSPVFSTEGTTGGGKIALGKDGGGTGGVTAVLAVGAAALTGG